MTKGRYREEILVSYTDETLPEVTDAELARLDAIKDEDIDCSDIPEITDFSGFHPWKERKLTKPVTV